MQDTAHAHAVKALQTAPSATQGDTASSRHRLPPRWLAALWARLGAMYGHRWASSFGDDPTGPGGDTWALGLGMMTPDQIAQGLRATEQSPDPWPPSMQQFRARCLGIPDFAEVLPMLREGAPDVSPFVQLVWRHLDPYALRMANAGAERAMIRDAYDLAARHLLNGGELPERSARLEHDPRAELALYDRLHRERFREFIAPSEKGRDDDSRTALDLD